MIAWGGIFASKYMNMYRCRFFKTCFDLHVFPPHTAPIYIHANTERFRRRIKKKQKKNTGAFFPRLKHI